jgi:hypothetical protein
MMHAIPPSEVGQSYIYSLPNEVLGEIFDHLLALPLVNGEAPAPILVSHVCSHWRRVVVDLPAQWEVLRIRHTRRADVISDLLSRSRNREITLFIDLLKPMPYGADALKSFSGTFMAIVAHVSRLGALSIHTDNTTFHKIMPFLIDVPLSSLQHLEFVQNGDKPYCFFGPLVFNPDVFINLRLERAMIDCDASCLTGLLSLDLCETSGTMLNQHQLSFLSYPDIPATPTMAHLSRLRIRNTSLILTNSTLKPSFSLESLLCLELSYIHMTTPHTLHSIVSLFTVTLNPLLEELVLHNIDNSPLHALIQVISLTQLKFTALHSLTISDVDLRALAPFIVPATPAIRHLMLMNVGVDLGFFREILRDVDRWPLITMFKFNRVNYLR